MKRGLIIVFIFSLMMTGVVSAGCNEVEKITPDSSVWQGYPAISNEKIVWVKEETNIKDDYWSSDLYVYDLQTGSSNKITNNLATQDIFESSSNPKISGDKIVWKTNSIDKVGEDLYISPESSLSLYDLSSGQKTQILDYGSEIILQNLDYAIHENKVTWVGEDTSGHNVYLYDISKNLTTKIINQVNSGSHIDIYENKIVWVYTSSEGATIYLYDSGGQGPRIINVSSSTYLQIYKNKIAYIKYNSTRGNLYGNANYDLHIYNIDNGQNAPINLGDYSNLYIDANANFRMDADKIVFPLIDAQGHEKGIFVYDINDKTTIKLEDTDDDKMQGFIDTQNSKFVWVEWKSDINSIKFYDMVCCISNCTNKNCGDDGCGGVCGTCESGKTCSNGTCISGEGVECNEDFDCIIPDMGPLYCEGNSVCVDFGSHECINPGTLQSYCNSTPVHDCTPCVNGCKNNECITSFACEPIGLREDRKYCASDNEWEYQKPNNRICENNFECQSNDCKSERCFKEGAEPNYILYSIIGGVIALIIVGGIIIISKLNR